MFRIASRYKGKVASWEIWNEPDIPEYWNGTVEQFAELTREGARQVRRADPEARIVLAGMAKGGGPFLAELITEHGAAEWVDIVNVHGYHETWTQDRAESYPDLLRSVRELAGFVSPARDVWFAEFGYSDQRHSPTQVSVWGVDAYYAYEHTPAYQASALWKHHVLAVASESPSLTAWYRINDLPHGSSVIGDANNRHLGILDVHGRPKPAFRALRFYNAFFDEPSRLVNGRQSSAASASSQQVLHLFEEKDGDLIVTGWLRSPLPDEIRLKGKSAGKLKDTRRESLSVQLPSFEGGTKRELTVYDELGNVIADHGVSIDAKGFLTGVELRGERPFIAEIKAPVD